MQTNIHAIVIKEYTKYDEKRIIYALLFTIVLVLSACSNGDIDDNDHHANGIHAPKMLKITEKDIFSSNKQNEKLSEKR